MNRSFIRCLVALEMAAGLFDGGAQDAGMAAYAEATRIIDQELTHPEEFLRAFIEAEHVLRTYIWRPEC
ncbi:MAG: hypothetical protein RLZZ450_107 [Pseudomonadota bacterium]|jgi:hypothetical protein